ncbi:MAG: diguanylate cyclase (GGDEF)-like protein [Gammaproteobacteria bacterium]|jgi:diguanylate cyclase (GGDEF)-like protein
MEKLNTEHTDEINEQVYAEQISILYTSSVTRPALHFFSLVILLSVVLDHVNPVYVYTWAMLLVILNIYRVIDINKTQKNIAEITDFKEVHKRFACCAGLLGAIYGVGVFLFFPHIHVLDQVYLLLLISVMTPAGLVSFASDKLTFNLYFFSMVLPPIVWFFSQGEFQYFSIGFYSIIYVFVVMKLFEWNHNSLTSVIRLKIENADLAKSLLDVNSKLMELSSIDELTQISNRRSLDDLTEKEWARAKRFKTPIAMMMIDIDYFKEFNDKFGHLKGDECLVSIAKYMKDNLNRAGDYVARYGGEEFCIVMPETNLSGAMSLAENIHSGVRELKIPNPESKVSKYVTISIGVTSIIPGSDDSHMDLIHTIDKALYKAKNDGRNIIRTAKTIEKRPKAQLVI